MNAPLETPVETSESAGIYDRLPAIESVDDVTADNIPAWVFEREQPLVLRGLGRNWPALPQGAGDLAELRDYLSKFWSDEPVTAYMAAPEEKGRFGYNTAFDGFNFRSGRAPLADIFTGMKTAVTEAEGQPPAIYVGSTPVRQWLPGFLDANPLVVPGDPQINFWLGNRTTVAAHFDVPSNIACVVYGRRRFTLFPMSQLENLYVGPIDRTPSGQSISLVDFDNPDFEKYPRFAKALEHAQTVVLEPGDAIMVPGMWWHQVKALSDCNLLINAWYLENTAVVDSPYGALLNAILSIRGLPAYQRDAWRTIIDHYVFDADEETLAHIPEHARGCLGELNAGRAQWLRQEVARRLASKSTD